MLFGDGKGGGVLSGERAAVFTGVSGEATACSLAREGRRRQSLGPEEKTPKPLLSAKQN